MKNLAAFAVAIASLVGCATPLTDAGSKVRVVNEQNRTHCRFIKLLTVRVSLGPDKPGEALKQALNEAAAAGGNGLFIVTNVVHLLDGASVAGEALACPESML